LALIDPPLQKLWDHVVDRVPDTIPTLSLALAGSAPADLLSGLIAQLHLVARIARAAQRDIGKPSVASFGKELYYADLEGLIPPKVSEEVLGLRSKGESIGAKWPSRVVGPTLTRALSLFKSDLSSRSFRAIVFDYDGTLSISQSTDAPPPDTIVQHLRRLTEANIVIGIASGRGNSLQDIVRDATDSAQINKKLVRLGLYNGGWIGAPTDDIHASGESEFLNHAHRIVAGLKLSGVPIYTIRLTQPFQISVRFRLGVNAEAMWTIVVDAIRQAGLDQSTIFRSKHSVDILAPGVGKSHLVADIVQSFGIDPYEVLTIGDLGAWPGNDSSLLEHRYSLSVDLPSRRLDRGWKLAPQHLRDVDATSWYLERAQIIGETFRMILD
jgi:hypothetical protein